MTLTVLAYGDSNTHGTAPMATATEKVRFDPEIRWTGHARGLLPADTILIEEGHPGRTTVHDDPIEGAHRNGLAILPAILESHRPLDAVILMLGTNDMKARFSVTAEDVAASLDRLIRTIRAAEAGPDLGEPKVLLVCPPPVAETGCLEGMFRGGAAKSAALTPLAARVAEAQGAGFLDAGAHIAVSPVDGVHFDAEAHAVLGRAIGAAVAEMMG
ncbi:SGNH/GDSL hydrolase family protein [Defluviimonas sp. SAOS-178_SWC]|uniref:SGNH/GDSL hydrolase family protein n=1 Tax=Defluviimonas sp. SAOS-178_SWC TaxID=3121287 RepID=UPI0032214C25